MRKCVHFLIAVAIWTSSSFADDICARVFEARRHGSQHSYGFKSGDALRHFPDSLSAPIVEAIASYGEGEVVPGSRNLIIVLPSLKPRHALSPEELERFTAFKSEYQRFSAQKALLESFFDKRTEEGCRRAMREAHFDYDAFRTFAAEISADVVGRSFVEGEFLVDAIKQLQPSLKRRWEIAQGYTADEILWLLSAPDLRHVVVVAHGDDDGQMRDFQNDPLSLDAFFYLPASIASLTFYSCNSANAVELYRVRELFAWMPSVGKDRRSYYVKPQRIDGMDNVALMGLFGRFLREVDRSLED